MRSNVVTLDSRALVFLGVGTIVNLIVPAAFVRSIRNALSEAELKLRLQAWQLEQLVSNRRDGFSCSREERLDAVTTCST